MFNMMLVLSVVVSLYFILKSKYKYWEKYKVSHPKPIIFFGNFLKIVFLQETLGDLCKNIYKKFPKDAFVGFYKMWTPAVVVRDLNLIRKILIKDFNHFEDHLLTVQENVDPILAENPVCLKGSTWKHVRTQLTSQFTLSKLKATLPILKKVSQDLVLYINEQMRLNKSACIGVQELSRRFTGETVFMSAFGLEGKSFSDKLPITFQIGEEISGTGLLLKIKHLIGLLFLSLAKLLKITFIGRPVPESFRKIIVNAVKYRQLNNHVRGDYIDYITKLKGENDTELKEDSLVAHAFTYYLDGFETSAIAISFLLYELALNEDIQKKCRYEIETLLETCANDLTNEALSQMKYTDTVIFETLRKHPPVSVLSRVCTKDYTVPSEFLNGQETSPKIPKGAIVAIPALAIHYDPQYYPNSDAFNPDRFDEKNGEKKPFLSFGDGPRICLGRNFAMLQIKILIAAILSKYKIKLNKKTTVPYEPAFLHILNIPKNEIYVDFYELD